MSIEGIIKEGNKRIDVAIAKVIFRHEFQIHASKMADTLYRKGISNNSVPVSRIHIDSKQNRMIIELLSVAEGYMKARIISNL